MSAPAWSKHISLKLLCAVGAIHKHGFFLGGERTVTSKVSYTNEEAVWVVRQLWGIIAVSLEHHYVFIEHHETTAV